MLKELCVNAALINRHVFGSDWAVRKYISRTSVLLFVMLLCRNELNSD